MNAVLKQRGVAPRGSGSAQVSSGKAYFGATRTIRNGRSAAEPERFVAIGRFAG
jgi:hypothetical protein